MSRVLIVGATSAIGKAVAAELARNQSQIFLAGRDSDELERLAGDLRIRTGAEVGWGRFEASQIQAHEGLVGQAVEFLKGLEGAVICVGYLGDQRRAEQDWGEAQAILEANFTGAVSITSHIAALLESRRCGWIIGISSVAGDRGRQSNYLYGASKAGYTAYLQGLRNHLHPAGVHVLTVKPGFVDSSMTYGRPGLFLVASPEDVARASLRALRRGRNVVYVPWFWRPIMSLVRLLPEEVFKRLKT